MIDKQNIEQQVESILTSKTAGRIQRLLQSRVGLWLIAAISFFESALPVPLITDPFMVAAILANRSRAALIVVITAISSVIGGVVAFAAASYFFHLLLPLMSDSVATEFHELVSFGASDTFVTSITGAVTPIPYTITAWVVAVAEGSVWLFILASAIGRTSRYAIVGYCAYLFGPAALTYARRSLTVTSLVVLALVALYIYLKL